MVVLSLPYPCACHLLISVNVKEPVEHPALAQPTEAVADTRSTRRRVCYCSCWLVMLTLSSREQADVRALLNQFPESGRVVYKQPHSGGGLSRSRQLRMTRLLRADGATVLSNLLDPSRRRISTTVFCTNLCANPSRRDFVTRRRLFDRHSSLGTTPSSHLLTPRHRRSLPAAFARPSTFLAIRNPPPTPSATARYTLSQIPHQHTSQNACCHVPFFLLLTSNEL